MEGIKAVIYARYSSHNQKELSIEGQLRECVAYAEKKKYTVIETYIDRAMSARTDARPEFQRMIRDSAKHQFTVIICYKLNRFSRDRYDSAVYKAALKKNGVRLVYVQENIPQGPEGIILESVMEGLAEYYSAELAQNVNRGMYDTAMKCQSVGGHITFGYSIGADKKYVIDESTAPIVQRVFSMWNEGARMRDILDYVNALGVKTTMGKPFSNSTIASIVRNRRYTGVYIWREVEIPGGIPRLISDEVYQAAQDRAEKGRVQMRSGKPAIAYDLTTKLFCGYCEAAMVGESGKSSGNGEKYCYYSCLSRKRDHSCAKKNVRKDWVERNVVELTRLHVLQPDVISKIIDAILDIEKQENENGVIASLRAQEKEVGASLGNIMKAIEQGAYSPSIQSRLDELEKQRADLQVSIARESMLSNSITKDQLQFLFADFANGDVDSPAYRRRLIDAFVNAVYLTDDEITIVYNYKNGQERLRLEDLPFQVTKEKALSESSDSTHLGGA